MEEYGRYIGRYIIGVFGVKIILATEESKDGIAGYKVRYPGGYESWSPKATFEIAYRQITNEELALCR